MMRSLFSPNMLYQLLPAVWLRLIARAAGSSCGGTMIQFNRKPNFSPESFSVCVIKLTWQVSRLADVSVSDPVLLCVAWNQVRPSGEYVGLLLKKFVMNAFSVRRPARARRDGNCA